MADLLDNWRRQRMERVGLYRAEALRLAVSLAEWGALKVILFGSVAKGDVYDGSDLDVIVIKETEAPFIKRLEEVTAAVQTKVPADILVYTPEEFAMVSQRAFFKQALSEGEVLYERHG